MLSIRKTRVISALLLSIAMASAMARPADVPLGKSSGLASPRHAPDARSFPRPLSRRQIFQAIQNQLAKDGVAWRGNLRPGDLIIQTAVPSVTNDGSEGTGLEVKRISFDPLRRETIFELRAARAPQYLPFEVTTRRDAHLWGSTPPASQPAKQSAAGDGTATAAGASQVRTKAPVLARPGRPATLVILGENLRITTTVVPLQQGIKGQCILVRELATTRVMKAEVVGEGFLEARL